MARTLTSLVALVLVAALSGCKQEGSDAAAPAPLPPPAADGQARRIDIKVGDRGYTPGSTPARAGEKLVLVFTRTVESECAEEVIVGDQKVKLPLGKPVDIPVTMPRDGELIYTCGMKMLEGKVVVR